MSIVLITGISSLVLMAINANLIKLYLDDATKYKCDIYDQEKIFLLYVFFGLFLLPFKKRLKRYRKILYLKKRYIDLTENIIFTMLQDTSLTNNKIEEEIFHIERLLKLERLKKKI